jgi:hypothetical protein
LSERFDLTVDIHVEMSGSGQTFRSDVSSVVAFRSDALPNDKVVVPSVDADALVVPGKAIGAFSLTKSLADLTRVLGPPQPVSAPDFRGDQAGWSNGLWAHLNATDRTTVLGLGVASPRYRTDKGLGFGSSQGAVMFAYGMSPVRVEMLRGGAYRVLVYNDQGIAFAITADRAHVGHAPIGGVDWMVIFPPGSAGKIFPLS